MPTDLALRCHEALQRGSDFPTIWHTLIKPHAAVAGIPVQRLDNGGRPFVEIPLVGGRHLVIHHEERTARLG